MIKKWWDKRCAAKLSARVAKQRDADFQALKAHCSRVQKERAAYYTSYEAEKKSCEELRTRIKLVESENDTLEATRRRNEAHIEDLKILIETLTSQRDMVKAELALKNMSVEHLMQIVERDRERVIAERNVYTAMGEKAAL